MSTPATAFHQALCRRSLRCLFAAILGATILAGLGIVIGRQPAPELDLAQWAAHQRSVSSGETWLNVKLDKVSMYLYPRRDDLAVVTFDQTYTSSNLDNRMRKRLYWIREGVTWRIIHEGAA